MCFSVLINCLAAARRTRCPPGRRAPPMAVPGRRPAAWRPGRRAARPRPPAYPWRARCPGAAGSCPIWPPVVAVSNRIVVRTARSTTPAMLVVRARSGSRCRRPAASWPRRSRRLRFRAAVRAHDSVHQRLGMAPDASRRQGFDARCSEQSHRNSPSRSNASLAARSNTSKRPR
jgi:hypothetical protein